MGGDRLVAGALERPDVGAVVAAAERVVAICIGKAAASMWAGLSAGLGAGRVADALLVTEPDAVPVGGARVVAGSHPVPTERSVAAAVAVESFVLEQRLGPHDLVVACISGGASSLVCSPAAGLTLDDVAGVTRTLLLSGVDVTRLNAIRRVASRLHGGGLARLVAPATCLGLVLSDNVQIGIGGVGSAPTIPLSVPDLEEARAAIGELVADASLRARLLDAVADLPADPPSHRVVNAVVGGPGDALDAAAAAAPRLGYRTVALTDRLQGEARDAARAFGSLAAELASEASAPTCLLAAGEVTVTVTGRGTGGRCQEFAWAVARDLDGFPAAFAAVATDGCDFVRGVGGAWVDGDTARRGTAHGFDSHRILDDNDSHSALAALECLLPGGPTGTNLCDLYVLCVKPSQRREDTPR